jgi:hypothetical protein
MGADTVNMIILNVFVPVFFHYSVFRKRNDLKDKLLDILEELPAEKNKIISRWRKYGIVPMNAFESQSLVHLATRYCEKRKCLECRIGAKLISCSA